MKAFIVVSVIIFSCVNLSVAQEIQKISKADLVKILNDPSDKLHVLNFWATWCAPCVKELPDFQQKVNESDKSKVDFLFISLDFPSDGLKKLTPFMKKNNYTFKVLLMTETDANSWIDLVDPSWQGNIPATLFYNNARKVHHFISESIDKSILDKTINSLLNN